MTSTVLDRFWEVLGWVLSLNGEVFRQAIILPGTVTLATLIVIMAGFSQAIAQSIILFINQVKPGRFVLSLLVNALLFAAGFCFLVFSTWFVMLLAPWVKAPFATLFIVLGLSYAPLLFSFLGALPHLGYPLLNLLAIWNLLAMVVGVAAATGIRLGSAFGYVVIGWVFLQILQQTLGRSIARLGQWLANRAAGVELATDPFELRSVYQERVQQTSAAWRDDLRQRIVSVRQSNPIQQTDNQQTDNPGAELTREFSTLASPPISDKKPGMGRTVRTILGLLGMALLTMLVVIFLQPLREWWFGWYDNLRGLSRLLFDLFWISLIAIVVAGLLAPLESLGWWAGWYEDEVDTTVNLGELQEPIDDAEKVSRYLVYLDGICQSDFKYLPDVEEFLDTLGPSLPEGMALIRGLMVYSVLNNPLDEDRPLAFLWKLADRNRYANPADLLGYLINLRNVIMVAVSADKRYGPLYNQGIAQVVYNSLIKNGYQPGSGTPVTLIGYSGGGQMAAASAPYLQRALRAPVDLISLGGVFSANNNFLVLEHLYHLHGGKDAVERLGPLMFPGRWKVFALSYWNRAKRRGKVSLIDMDPAVGHQIPGGILDPNFILADGRSSLQQTIDAINTILRGDFLAQEDLSSIKLSHYELYMQAAFNRPDAYPIQQSLAAELYQPIGEWMGRLILPPKEERQQVRGCLFQVYHASPEHRHLIGQIVKLRWSRIPALEKLVAAVTQDIHFSAEASYTSKHGGLVHPDRLNHWLQVNPLESLAGARTEDDLVVMLEQPVEVEADGLYIRSTPIQITGRYQALVRMVEALSPEEFRVVHFNRRSRQFDGPQEVVRMPQVVLAEAYGSYPSTAQGIEQSPLNETGWYLYGTQNHQGQFVVQALGPRALFRLQPEEVIFGSKASYNYVRHRVWADPIAQKGKISSVLCTPRSGETSDALQTAIDDWQAGDRALLMHVYGGIGGNQAEPAATAPIFFGHFAYGIAEVVRDPLSGDLKFDLRYHQVYTHNTDGLIAGTLHWSRYLGDRQFGWLGNRPVADFLIRHPAFTEPFDSSGQGNSALDYMLIQLQVMTARYRTGDGTGGTYVGPANNCAQDSNQVLFASMRQMEQEIRESAAALQQWAAENPEQGRRFEQLVRLGRDLKQQLQPWGGPRSVWERNELRLGSTLEDQPIANLISGLASWRTLLPRLASETVAHTFLKHGATIWVLRTNQVGGHNPNIEPVVPTAIPFLNRSL